jgi:uncharacterized membrane protein
MITQYASVLVLLVVIDAVWLGLVARGFYRDQIGTLMRDDILWTAAIAFYLLYAAGLTYFALGAADRTGSWLTALGTGAAIGLLAYGTYDLTNLATVRGFTPTIALVDMAWGTVLSAVVSAGAFVIANRITG